MKQGWECEILGEMGAEVGNKVRKGLAKKLPLMST